MAAGLNAMTCPLVWSRQQKSDDGDVNPAPDMGSIPAVRPDPADQQTDQAGHIHVAGGIETRSACSEMKMLLEVGRHPSDHGPAHRSDQCAKWKHQDE